MFFATEVEALHPRLRHAVRVAQDAHACVCVCVLLRGFKAYLVIRESDSKQALLHQSADTKHTSCFACFTGSRSLVCIPVLPVSSFSCVL